MDIGDERHRSFAQEVAFVVGKSDNNQGGNAEDDSPSPSDSVDDLETRRRSLIDSISAASEDELSAHEQVRASFHAARDGGETQAPSIELPTEAPVMWESVREEYDGTPVDFVREHYSPWIGVPGFDRPYLRKLDTKLAEAYGQRVRNHELEDLGIPARTYTKRLDEGVEAVSAGSGHIPTKDLTPAQREARRAAGARRNQKYRDRKKLALR